MEQQQKIELLSVDLLDQNRRLVEDLRELADSLGIELGWHFLMDFTWTLSQLEAYAGMKVLDAGEGIGLLQWFLASKGAEVISADKLDRGDLPLRLRAYYRVTGLRENDLRPPVEVLSNFLTGDGTTRGRPTWVTWARDGALLVSDDTAGIIWRVIAATAAPAATVKPVVTARMPPQRELKGDPNEEAQYKAGFRDDQKVAQ